MKYSETSIYKQLVTCLLPDLISKKMQLLLLLSLAFLSVSTSGYGNTTTAPHKMLTDTVPLIFEAPIGTERMRIDSNGYLGIGTMTPHEQLEITGNLRLPSTTDSSGILRSDEHTLMHTFGETNLFIGIDAGNLTTAGANNTAVGMNALAANIDGVSNTVVGVDALDANTFGNNNTATGRNALGDNTEGSNNTAMGSSALRGNTIGDNNIAFGGSALRDNSSGFNNTAIGKEALMNNTEGVGNTAVGWHSMINNTTGFNNTLIGSNASISTGDLSNAAAIGANSIVSADNSLVLGATAGVPGIKVGIGDSSPDALLEVDADGLENDLLLLSSNNDVDGDIVTVKNNGQVGIGTPSPEIDRLVIEGATEATSSIALNNSGEPNNRSHVEFRSAGAAMSQIRSTTPNGVEGNLRFRTASDATLTTHMTIESDGHIGMGTIHPGFNAGASRYLSLSAPDLSGARSIMALELKGFSSTTIDEVARIDFNTLGSNSNVARIGVFRGTTGADEGEMVFYTSNGTGIEEHVRINKTGNVGIGTNGPGVRLEVEDNTIDGNLFRLDDSDGQCDYNPESGSIIVSCTSDARLKSNINDAPPALDELMKLRIREYTIKASGNKTTGLIAQEVREVMPHLVSEGEDGYLMVSQINHWKMVKAIQELKEENNTMKTELAELRTMLQQALGSE